MNRSERAFELVSTVLLALATVATAWSAYQSRQWTGVQSEGYSKATATRIGVNRVSALASSRLVRSRTGRPRQRHSRCRSTG